MPKPTTNYFEDDIHRGVMALPQGKGARIRGWIGMWIVRFGLWVAGVHYEMERK